MPFRAQIGTYNITAAQTIAPEPTQTATPEVTPAAQTTATENNSIPTSAGAASLSTTASKYARQLWIGFIIFIVACVGYGLYHFYKRKNK